MVNKITKNDYIIPIWVIALHILLGIGAATFPIVARLWGIIPIILGTFFIVKNKDRNGEAALWTAYYVGLEVLLRITDSTVGYEMGKYSIILFLLLGEFFAPPRKREYIWLLLIYLLIPSIFLNTLNAELFETIRFTLSGLLSLAVACFYFSGRIVPWSIYKKILAWILLPLVSLCVILTIKTPDLSTIEFTANSTSVTTGGFGPVHVSAVLGCALLIMTIIIIIKQNLFYNMWGNYVVLGFFAFRAILTFARSGIFAFIGSLALTLFYIIYSKQIKIGTTFLYSFIGLVLFGFIWQKIDNITGGMAYNRYTGRNTIGEIREDMTTGRTELFWQEIALFKENPYMGIGVGEVSTVRMQKYNLPHTSHTEYSRLLAEHGLLGLCALCILVGYPIAYLRKTKGFTKIFFIAFITYCLLSLTSASTRIALPLFVYGLAFLKIKEDYQLTQ